MAFTAPDSQVPDLAPGDALDSLARCDRPHLIGVRHHSAALAVAMPSLLDDARPERLFIELPEELQGWLEWLTSPELRAPVALAAVSADGMDLGFYPFADFSPELAAIRWAGREGVPVQAFDLPVGLARDVATSPVQLAPDGGARVSEALQSTAGIESGDDLWDRLVEARAPGQSPESVRRAALAVGWALRADDETHGDVSELDRNREAWMRSRLHAAGERRITAVVGAYHCPALLRPEPDHVSSGQSREVATSLVPYSFDLLDSRSGYPAGIRDPEWHQAMWEGGCAPEWVESAAADVIVRVCRTLRELGHPAGVPDAREAVRLALDLARLRSLPAPGRRELVEAIQTCLTQGEPWGRGRAVARAMERVLVGSRRGRLASGTPRSGLAPHVETLLADLRLPGPESEGQSTEIRLDPLRSELDRRRHVTLHRLAVCGVTYAQVLSGPDFLTGRWQLQWTPATAATLELAGLRGVTLEQAAGGALRTRLLAMERESGVTAAGRLQVLEAASESALPDLIAEQIDALDGPFLADASLPELISALELVERMVRGHIPGFQPDTTTQTRLSDVIRPALLAAAVHQLEGLIGSDRVEDARALLALVQRARLGQEGESALGDSRLRWALQRLARDGSPLMQGAAGSTRVVLGHEEPMDFAERLGSWIDAAPDAAGRRALAGRMTGVLVCAAPLLESAPSIVHGLIERVAALDDASFLQRLPALREAFDTLSPGARRRFLAALEERLGPIDMLLESSPLLLTRWAQADHRGREAVLAHDPEVLAWQTNH